MYSRLLFLSGVLFLTGIMLAGCETVKGIGRDIQNSGEVMNDVFYVKERYNE